MTGVQQKSKKMLISNEYAFREHYVQGRTWAEIAREHHQLGKSISARVRRDYVDPLAIRYMNGENLKSVAKTYEISEGELHIILRERLKGIRGVLLVHHREHELNPDIGPLYADEVSQIANITNFLCDEDDIHPRVWRAILDDAEFRQDG